MIQSVADYLGVAEDVFERTGAFNAMLGKDTQLFISPVLLQDYRSPDFGDGFRILSAHVEEVMSLLAKSNGFDDSWDAALKTLRFEEVPEIGLGYSLRGTLGSRISRPQKELLLRGLHRLVRLGVSGAQNLAFAMPLETGLGPDTMSDFLASVIRKELLRFTQSVCEKLAVPAERLRAFRLSEKDSEVFHLPVHPSLRQRRRTPETGESSAPRPIILIPKALLSPMPNVTNARRLASLYPSESQERRTLTEFFTAVAARVKARELTRADIGGTLEAFLARDPAMLDYLVRRFAEHLGPYDWKTDPASLFWFYRPGKQMARQFLDGYIARRVASPEQLHEFIQTLCISMKEQFDYGENTESLFVDGTTDEKRIQTVLDVTFTYAGKQVGLHPHHAALTEKAPDFEFSLGSDLTGCIEIKLLDAGSDPVNAEQLEAYQKMKAYSTFALMVFLNGAKEGQLAKAQGLQCTFPLEKYFIKITPQTVPSKRKKEDRTSRPDHV